MVHVNRQTHTHSFAQSVSHYQQVSYFHTHTHNDVAMATGTRGVDSVSVKLHIEQNGGWGGI